MFRICFAMALILTLPASWRGEVKTYSFKDLKSGEIAKGWHAAKTGEGEGSVWKIVDDATADDRKALAQTAASPSAMFNLCTADDSKFGDGELTVKFKANAGEIDQGGGPVWRYKDQNNYYICRVNPLEENFRLYKVVDGKRTTLASANTKAEFGKWHTILVKHTGKQIECSLNGQKLLEALDDSFSQPGKIGLWTKADAQTSFCGVRMVAKTP